jgi:fluoride exporter
MAHDAGRMSARKTLLPGRHDVLAVALGGAAGGLLRTVLADSFHSGTGWPWVTFAVNIAGTLLLGYVVTRHHEASPLPAYRRPLIGNGFCGALTTFSTLQLELLEMIDDERFGLAIAYVAASVGAGFVGVHLATAATRRLGLVA